MLEIKKRYVVDEQDRPVAVQIDLETFAKIEEQLESRMRDEVILSFSRNRRSIPAGDGPLPRDFASRSALAGSPRALRATPGS